MKLLTYFSAVWVVILDVSSFVSHHFVRMLALCEHSWSRGSLVRNSGKLMMEVHSPFQDCCYQLFSSLVESSITLETLFFVSQRLQEKWHLYLEDVQDPVVLSVLTLAGWDDSFLLKKKKKASIPNATPYDIWAFYIPRLYFVN